MIIDCHGHYTTAPKALQDYRDAQIAALKDPAQPPYDGKIDISDDAVPVLVDACDGSFG